MKTYIIEREIPGVGSFSEGQYCEAAKKSNGVLAELGPGIRWLESFVAGDRTFCVYQAESEEIIKKHAELSGFPASKITEIETKISPETAKG